MKYLKLNKQKFEDFKNQLKKINGLKENKMP